MYHACSGVFKREKEGQRVKGQSVQPELVAYWE